MASHEWSAAGHRSAGQGAAVALGAGPPTGWSDGGAFRVDGREVAWDGLGSMATQIYDETALVVGTSVCGPAIIETPITNYAVAPGWSATVDQWGNLAISRDE